MEYAIDLEEMLENKPKDSIWNKTVPIRKVGKTYHCYISGDIGSPDEYNELTHLLEVVEENNTVILHINTGGGYIDSAFQIVAAIKRSKAELVVARIVGTVASAGTIIALSCDDLEVEKHTHFMIHNYSTGTQGKGHEVMDFINFNDRTLRATFKEIYNGFLTPQEMEDVLRGKDMWLDSQEVKDRWEAYKS